jgi:hypothetical protein
MTGHSLSKRKGDLQLLSFLIPFPAFIYTEAAGLFPPDPP